MAQTSRQATRVPEAVPLNVGPDYASARADNLRQMRRLAAGRRRAIDDRRTRARCQHPRDNLRRFRLRMEQTVAIAIRFELWRTAQHDRLGRAAGRADLEPISAQFLDQLVTRPAREIQSDHV